MLLDSMKFVVGKRLGDRDFMACADLLPIGRSGCFPLQKEQAMGYNSPVEETTPPGLVANL